MKRFIKRVALVATAFIALGVGQATLGLSAFATSSTTNVAVDGIIPLEFKPICSDATSGLAYWEVYNKNDYGVEYAWANQDGNDPATDTGIEIAPARGSDAYSTSDLVTSYYQGENNMTDFVYAGSHEGIVSRNATAAACDPGSTPIVTPPAATCVDIDQNNKDNLTVVWNDDSHITITTKDGLPACQTVNLYYSTYRMPDTYDGNGFDSTAYPQTHLASYAFTINKGDRGVALMNVPTPDYCYNVQADVYYAPHINGINAQGQGYDDNGNVIQQSGHGTQLIAYQVFNKNAAACTPGRGAGNGGTTTGGSTTTTTTSAAPTVLPNTGVEDLGTNVLGSLLTLGFTAASLMGLGIRSLRQYR